MQTSDFIRLLFSHIKFKTVDMCKLKLEEFIGDSKIQKNITCEISNDRIKEKMLDIGYK